MNPNTTLVSALNTCAVALVLLVLSNIMFGWNKHMVFLNTHFSQIVDTNVSIMFVWFCNSKFQISSLAL